MKSTLVRRALLATLWAALGALLPGAGQATGQEVRIERSAVTLSSGSGGRAALELELAGGAERVIAFADGAISLDGDRIGGYEPGGTLVTAWRAFLRDQAGTEPATLREGLEAFIGELEGVGRELGGAEGESSRALVDAIGGLLGVERTSETDETTTQVEGPGGSRLSIAPGGVRFDELLGQLDRLRGAMGRLGGAADGAAERLALIVHDDFTIPMDDVIDGNLALLDGALHLEGRVSGDVLILDGDLIVADGARIDGNILQVGGDVELAETAVLTGEILSDFPSGPSAAASVSETPAAGVTPAPPAPVVETRLRDRRPSRGHGFLGRIARNFGHATEEFTGALSAFIVLGVLGLLLVYFAHARLETVADTVRHEFARSFAMGLAGEVLFFPALLILAVLVITWPIVPFFVLGTGLAMVIGYLAVAHGAGEMFAQRRYRYQWLERLRRSNSYYYVLSGLVLLLLPFAAAAVLWVAGGTLDFFRGILAFVACVGTWILVTSGFGAVLLTRAGSRSVVVDWRSEGGASLDPLADAEPSMRTGAGPSDPGPQPAGADETPRAEATSGTEGEGATGPGADAGSEAGEAGDDGGSHG